MKNLKKILIALAVVALLVSSLAFIVSAEGEFSGELKKLYNNYAAVDANANANKQASALADAYNYLQGNTFDPSATYEVKLGTDTEPTALTYDDIVAMMSERSVAIGQLYLSNLAAANNAATRFTVTGELLDHLAACPPTEGTAGAAELIATAKAKNIDAVREQYTIISAQVVSTAQKNVVTLYNHINKHPLDATASDLKATVDAFAVEIAAQLYADWNAIPTDHVDVAGGPDDKCDYCGGTMTSATSAHYHGRYNGIYTAKYYIASIGLFVNGSVPTSAPAEAQVVANNIVAGCKVMDAEKTAKQYALDAEASFDEYDYGKPYMTYDCENTMLSSYNANAECFASAAVDIFGNKYHNFHYGDNAVHLYTEPQAGQKNAYQLGMVIEWDQMFDDGFTGIEYVCRHPSVAMTTAFTIEKTASGIVITNILSAATGNKVEKVTRTNVIVTNVWEHFTLTYDHETRTGKLYVNYDYICDIEYSDTPTFQFVGFRMGKSVTKQNHGYDNFTVMNGSQYRIWDKFDKMTESEKFDYYVGYMTNEENSSLTRNAAYNKAKLLYTTIKEKYPEACAASLAAYDACDYNETIKKPAMAENLAILSGMVDELLAMSVNSATTSDVNSAINAINNFVSVNGELINKGDTSETGYQALMMKVNTAKADLVKIENIIAFVSALTKFERATTIASMTKYAETAQAVYALGAYDVAENVNFVKNDPVVLSFEATINGDVKPADEGYITLFEYYATVAEKIANRSLYENSKRVIACMNFIISMPGYSNKVEFWTENADTISGYVAIAREIITTGNYDPDVAGLELAIERFRVMDVFFYELLQQEHVAFIKAQLDKYVATEAYIDKVGVCTVVKQYLAENDLAVYNTAMTDEVAAAVADEIAALEELIIVYNVYNDELVAQEEDYKAVLEQNTQYFINAVNHMTTVLTYAELKPMFEKATGYYYSIDVDSDEAAAAADKYIAYREQLEAWETNGAIFIGFVDGLAEAEYYTGVEREDMIYAALVNCTAYADLIDESVPGVAAAVAKYEAALAAYNAELDIVNGDISETAKITCAVRTGSISTIVLAIVSKIFAN